MGFPYPYPLGLPKGSVRATLTLILSVNFIILQYQQQTIAENFSVLVAIALTFYFGGRMRASTVLTPKQADDASLRAWGMPAGTIRGILFIMFSGIALFVYIQDGGLPNYLQSLINLIFGHLLGSIWNGIKKSKTSGRTKLLAEHLQALLSIGIVGATYYITLISPFPLAIQDLWIDVAAVTLGFYFGERK